MIEFSKNPMVIGGMALALGLALTFGVRAFARRYGFVAKPKSDRWHKRPTALLGGVAIFLTTIIIYALFVPKTNGSLVIMAGSTFLFFVGLIDDLLEIKPYQKLIGQLIGVVIVVAFGFTLPLTGYELIDIWITIFWLIGITNAINLLDNMDGLAGGIAAIASFSLAFGFWANGQTNELILVSAFIGALVGFLFYNFNPASIFMGDCGSMFVGFLLASSVLLSETGGRSRGIFSILAVPVLILFVPIFDTTLVTIIRKMWGRKASQGGNDHTSHRLVALGLSERSAVLMIYAFAVCAGALSLLVSRLETTQSLAIIVGFTIVLTIGGVYLSKVKVYEEKDENLAVEGNAVFAFIVNVSYKRRIFEVFLDSFLISLAYYGAYYLIFGPFENTANWSLFIKTLPMLVVIKLFAFLFAGVYRGLWKYTSVADFFVFSKGVVFGTVLSILAILLIYRFDGFSRKLFVIDGILLLFVIAGSRLAFRMIREILPHPAAGSGRRVLIYGAGDGGEMVLRELRNNVNLNYQPVGFIDNNDLKINKIINGLTVYDAAAATEVCKEIGIEEIIISSEKITGETLQNIREMGRDYNIAVTRARLRFESLDFE